MEKTSSNRKPEVSWPSTLFFTVLAWCVVLGGSAAMHLLDHDWRTPPAPHGLREHATISVGMPPAAFWGMHALFLFVGVILAFRGLRVIETVCGRVPLVVAQVAVWSWFWMVMLVWSVCSSGECS